MLSCCLLCVQRWTTLYLILSYRILSYLILRIWLFHCAVSIIFSFILPDTSTRMLRCQNFGKRSPRWVTCWSSITEQDLHQSLSTESFSAHYDDVRMGAIASQITSLTIVYSIVYLDADQRKHQISASLAFVRGIHRGLVNSPHKWPVTQKMFPFDDVIMKHIHLHCSSLIWCRMMEPSLIEEESRFILHIWYHD